MKALALLLLLAPGSVAAAELVVPGKAALTPPPGWQLLDPRTTVRADQPQIVGARAGPPPLATFHAPTAVEGFTSTLIFREVPGVADVNEERVEEYRTNMAKGFGGTAVQVDKVEIMQHPGGPFLRGEWRYVMNGRPLKVVQTYFPGRGVGFVATYTTHVNAFARELPAIDASIASYRNLEPWYAWLTGRPVILYGLVALAVAFGVILFHKRRQGA